MVEVGGRREEEDGGKGMEKRRRKGMGNEGNLPSDFLDDFADESSTFTEMTFGARDAGFDVSRSGFLIHRSMAYQHTSS